MAHETAPAHSPAESTTHAAPVSPGKVAMWLFLATEVMFFTALIGSYVVLRAGSPSTAYSNLYPPATVLTGKDDAKGVRVLSVGPEEEKVVELFVKEGGYDIAPTESEKTFHHRMKELLEEGKGITRGRKPVDAEALNSKFLALGAKTKLIDLETYNWPKPYLDETNPLSINLTAMNTFFLICSSVTMVLALSAVQRGDQRKLVGFLAATVLIGGLFVGIQVIEYSKLGALDSHPLGIGRYGHFRPSASLFGSCFYTMTGFHGAHVSGGVVLLICILIQAMRGKYTAGNHSSVELAGLYWHFVDLVWIILFTVVYLI